MQDSIRKAFHDDGAVLVKGLLNQEQLARCREAYDWSVEHHGPHATRMFAGTTQQSHVDNANPQAKQRLEALVDSLPLGSLFSQIWGSRNVWYFAEEVFLKAGGQGSRTLWHQDTSYLPWAGDHWGNAWISFESVPQRNALEIIRGSHRGPRYDGTTFTDPDDPTQPLHDNGVLPRLPDIEAERKLNPRAYDILSWATEPGDVILLHPGSLHGGAPVDSDFPSRHTFVFRFFGDDATFKPLPSDSKAGYPEQGVLFTEELKHLSAGTPFRNPTFRKVV
ncbi:phytanoyl-CoA dioxygenase family protein [Pseudomonas juntendi]|uniref:Phytanoyl-CoA dioxygenase family protein n=1 Tax=Pseudomonas juntendi TaxID=2666183 RepID=A0A7W2PS23_9PSED|nr:phytanoyl-CoA dioxygenase family protein [Pseudomonas juntendi]MBA6058743.1 phytanoyl-CoA dioxygenase family protein [Pseudomonas juntendi]MBA6125977.1 phytanoyl-CoA dioxygenase family protein [Pseudomonas juntendi]